MSDVMKINEPYEELDKGGILPSDGSSGADFCRQNGIIYCWSESNLRYECAWWLNPHLEITPLVANLRATRTPNAK